MENIYRHVVHISTVHPDNDTRVFYKECRGLAQTGWHVTLIVQSECSRVQDGVDIKALPITKDRFRRMSVLLFMALRKAISEKADLYHLHDPELLIVGLVLKSLGHVVIYDMHENVPLQIHSKPWLPKFARKFISCSYKLFERLSLNLFGVVFAELSYKQDYNWVKKREVVLNLPIVDDLVLCNRERFGKTTVGYIGGVSRERGGICVAEAVASLREEGHDIEFECIGKVNEEVANNDIFKAGVNNGWLRSPGRMSPYEGWSLISRCHIGVALLHPIGNYLTSYPTKLFEYMAMGVPVLVSNFPLYSQIVDRHKCGMCVDPEDLCAITEAIRWLTQNPDIAFEMGARGRDAVIRHYNWKTELQKIAHFYGSCLSE